MNYLKDNDNYTIIIPTYNRHKYLKRILNFYSQYDSKLKIIILDSSSKNIDSELNSVMDQKEFDHHFDVRRLRDDQDLPASILSLNIPSNTNGNKDTRMVLFEYERDGNGNIDENNLTQQCIALINQKIIKIITDNL